MPTSSPDQGCDSARLRRLHHRSSALDEWEEHFMFGGGVYAPLTAKGTHFSAATIEAARRETLDTSLTSILLYLK